jgi:acetyltransferase-like isoleucine patch superfamily enzyme
MLMDAGLVGPSNARKYREDAGIKIGNNVWIGAAAIILAGVKVGDGAVVGARAVVTRDVEPEDTVAGNPAASVRRTTMPMRAFGAKR